MKLGRLAAVGALLVGSGTFASAQQNVKVGMILETWYTQMLDNNLRLDSPPSVAPYYANGAMNSAFKENQFYVRHTELCLNGKVGDQVVWGVVFDPNTSSNTTPAATNGLLDAWMAYAFNKQLSVKMGQFKMPMNYESTIIGGQKILFYDRSMTARMWAEKRDRGVLATYSVGDPNALAAKIAIGIGNGMTDSNLTYKANDTNAQKDYDFSVNATYGRDHSFGAWYREGETDVRDVNLVAGTFAGVNAPDAAAVLDNKDKTTNLGAYYLYDTAHWQGAMEVTTGLLGRRYPSVFPAGTAAGASALRQGLDQKYLGYTLSGAYKMGRHWFTARYDFLNFNQGDDWYAATNPYTTNPTTGAPTGNDFSPKYYEAIVGYNYLFTPAKDTNGKIKFDYIHRSKNFLAPRPGQGGEQGGDSLVMSVQIGF